MGIKAGNARHQAGDIGLMHHGNQQNHGGKIKNKACATVTKTNNRKQENYGSGQPK